MSLDFRTFQSAGRISSHIIPGAYSRVDSIKGAGGLASSSNGVVMGQSEGGEPNTLYQFNTVAQAVATLRGGPLMEAVRVTFSPGGGVSPQRVFAMRVNSAIRGTLDLEDSDGNKMITVTSKDYGLYVNQITVTVEAGSSHGKKLTIGFQKDPPEVFDNIRRQSFTIKNSGGASNMSIVNNSAAHTLKTTTTNPLNINLSDYPTLGTLVAYIDSQKGYECTIVPGQENADPRNLDSVTNQNISNAGSAVAESTMQGIIDAINSGSALVSAKASNGANSRRVIDNLPKTFLTGGSNGNYRSAEWSASLVDLESENIQFIATPDTDSAVHAAIKAHCEAMSSVTGRKERQFLLGAPPKTGTMANDIASAVTAAVTLNSKYGMYVFNGGTTYNMDGKLTDYPASYAACMLMGVTMATAINEPLTFKEVGLISLDYKLSESQTETLLKQGVAALNYAPNGVPRLVRQFNTWQSNDLKWNEFSAVTEMLFVSRDLRGFLEDRFVGSPGTSLTDGVLRGAAESRLAVYEDLGIFIKDPATGNSWWNVQIVMKGDSVYVDYDANITLPVNFIFVTNHFHELVASL